MQRPRDARGRCRTTRRAAARKSPARNVFRTVDLAGGLSKLAPALARMVASHRAIRSVRVHQAHRGGAFLSCLDRMRFVRFRKFRAEPRRRSRHPLTVPVGPLHVPVRSKNARMSRGRDAACPSARERPATASPAPRVRLGDAALDHRAIRLEQLTDGHKTELVEVAEDGQVGGREGSVVHVEVFRRMVSGRTSIIGRHRLSSGDRRAQPPTLSTAKSHNTGHACRRSCAYALCGPQENEYAH